MIPSSGPPAALLELAKAALEPTPSGLPSPRLWWVGPEGVVLKGAWTGPFAPRAKESDPPWSCLERLESGPVSALPFLEALLETHQWERGAFSPRSLLATPGVNPGKSLKKLGLKRVDRFLDRPLKVAIRRGPSFGGLRAAWLKQQGSALVSLAPYSANGWQALDLAAVSQDEAIGLQDLHGEGPAEARALELAHLAVALRRWALERDEVAGVLAAESFRALHETPPEQVQVQVQGPDWLDTSPWRGLRAADNARRTLHQLDGTWVGGVQCAVQCEPALRKGQRPVDREPQILRRRRLFSRWEQGIQVDDEGLLSATPEALALELVQGLSGRVLDGSCGAGAMAIAAARVGCQVVACDLNQERLEMARHNAALYGVQLELLRQDVRVALQDKFDALILDPPWGGRDYNRQDIRVEDLPFPLLKALELAPATVRIKLPRSFVCDSLPGRWSWRAAVDARGQLKFLVASR